MQTTHIRLPCMHANKLACVLPLAIQVAVYQITDTTLCNQVLKLFKSGVQVSIIVSARIVSYTDWSLAQACYGMLYNNGMQGCIRKALTKFSFAHQKYWIIDGSAVHLSTGLLRIIAKTICLYHRSFVFFKATGVPVISPQEAPLSHTARPILA